MEAHGGWGSRLGKLFVLVVVFVPGRSGFGKTMSRRKCLFYVGGHAKMLFPWIPVISKCHCCTDNKIVTVDHVLCDGEGPRKAWDFFAVVFGIRLP